jgi:Tfp pilus assembly protein FimT
MGVTLLEMIIVMSIIVIITVASVPSFMKFASTARLRAAARDITTALRTARRYAITQRTDYAATLYTNVHDSIENAVSFYETADSVELKHLPSTVQAFYGTAGTTEKTVEIAFAPRGNITSVKVDGTSFGGPSVTVRVEDDSNKIEITTQNTTGRVKIGEIEEK